VFWLARSRRRPDRAVQVPAQSVGAE